MKDLTHNIKIDRHLKSYGYLKGYIDDLRWYALIHKDEVDYGIDEKTLSIGYGRITKLTIFKEDTGFEGNPFTPSMSIKRTIYAEFDKGWIILNDRYIEHIEELIEFINRRYSFHVVR